MVPESSEQQVATSTIPDDPGPTAGDRRLRAVGLGVVLAVVLLSAAGMTGVRTTTASVSSSRFDLEVLHASIARPGLATPFSMTVRSREGPLPETVTVRVDAGYLEMFDEHGLTPTPITTHNDPDWTWWTFEVPEGSEALTVSLDARLEPSVQWRRAATVALLTGGETAAEVDLETWVLP